MMKNMMYVTVFASLMTPAFAENQMITVSVDGQLYDVQYDPYAPSKATIYGTESLFVFDDLPKAEIIAAATPCQTEQNPSVLEFSQDVHPTRPELDNLAVVTLQCS